MHGDAPQGRLRTVLAINLAVRFALELCALAAAVYWGYHAVSGAARWVLAIAAPLLVAVVWGMVVAPRARLSAPVAVRRLVEAAVFLGAGLGLAAAGQGGLGIVLVVVAAVSGALNHRFGWTRAERP